MSGACPDPIPSLNLHGDPHMSRHGAITASYRCLHTQCDVDFLDECSRMELPQGSRGRHRLTVVTGEVFDALATHPSHHWLTVDVLQVLSMPKHPRRTASRRGWGRGGQLEVTPERCVCLLRGYPEWYPALRRDHVPS